MGGATFQGIAGSSEYGVNYITLAIETIKSRTMTTVVAQSDEADLPKPVLSYLGKLVALELLPAARDWWSKQIISQSTGDDPVRA
jgi:hypothetical protein